MTTPRWAPPATRRSFVAEVDTTVFEVLRAMALDAAEAEAAIADGRVFIGRIRATARDHRVAANDEVILNPLRDAVPLPDPFVLHHAHGVLAVDKPAGISTVPDLASSAGTLLDLAARAIGKPATWLHPTSRLDREVSGIVTFATDDRAKALLADARAHGRYVRRYLALACGDPPLDEARWTWAIARDRDPRRRRAVDDAPDAKPSATRMRVVARSTQGNARYVLLALAPETGRTHQLRVHAARAGLPLLGDELYGGPRRLTASNGAVRALSRVALHCAAVSIDLTPDSTLGLADCTIRVVSPVPRELVDLASLVGFAPEVLLEASICPL